MRPRRAFRPTGDALEARWVTSSLAVHHATIPHHAEVHRAPHHAKAAAAPAITLINLFPVTAGTTFISTTTTPTTATTVLVNTPGSGASRAGSTLFSQVGPGYGVIVSSTPVTYPGAFTGAGGDLNGLVLYGGSNGTPGGDLNGLVIF